MDKIEISGIFIQGILALTSIIVLYFTNRNIQESFRPYVHLSVKIEGSMINMILQNTGSRAAYNVTFEFDKELYTTTEDSQRKKLIAFNFNTKSIFHSLAPNSIHMWHLDHSYLRYKTVNFDQLDDEIIGVTIRYADKYNGMLKYKEKYKFNLKNYLSYIHFQTEEEKRNEYLEKFEKQFVELNKILNKINSSTNTKDK